MGRTVYLFSNGNPTTASFCLFYERCVNATYRYAGTFVMDCLVSALPSYIARDKVIAESTT